MATPDSEVLTGLPPRARPGAWVAGALAGLGRVLGPCARLLREPLLHFLAYGAILFLLGEHLHRSTDIYRIVVTPQRQIALAKQYAAQFGIQPDPALLRTIVAGWIHDEILYREGLALDLDRHDQVVRDRVVQKMKFVMEDVAPPVEPTTEQLETYYRAHTSRYALPATATFTHVFFSTEGGQRNALLRAEHALAQLTRSDVHGRSELGDPFPGRYGYSAATRGRVESIFGKAPLSDEVFAAPLGRWVGPIRSAYGVHLLYVYTRAPRTRETFTDALTAVRADYLTDAQKEANRAEFDSLASKFTVVQAAGSSR
ncbi:MAG TPA: peptidylprolyl isomerase [Steroidobacteraceae bacterium]|nr:peptidylprolyl isomerase [Steroidobacteraceae bacterium]